MEERFGLPVKREHVYRGLEFRRAQIVREEPKDVYSLPVAQRMHTLERYHEWQAASLYLHEPGSFVPLARLDEKLVEPAFLATGTDGRFVQVAAKTRHGTYFYQNDHLGTPQEMVDESGKVVWLARYKAWGGVKRAPYGKADPVGADNRIRFQGQYHDEETGLAYNRHRYYDAQAGRFISKDPIGLAGGVNVYQYAPNPISWVDPLGLMGRNGAFRQAKRDAGIPMSQRPDSVTRTPMTSRGGCPVICNGKRVETREYLFTREDGSRVVIQDHGAGHQFGKGGIGDQGPHFNVRPAGETRNGSVLGTAAHYPFDQ
ncbi:hypothetical protein HHL14_32710 [Paraburkholderia sp. G-4-1-8]|uniref:HNH/Endo VII superfamily nuclease toxins domain-containing protein n=2 Tax=Paraburkholderia antibiotica TaxID=2728839 RepID=A0A7Y0FGZ9_9BURK|nr:hypothetical protein [Paraburkholderia antibiotica]